MKRLMAMADALFRRRDVESLAPWQVQCTCGRVVTGQRLRSVQTPVCPDCRTAFFILPASVYPRPRTPRRTAVAAPRPQTESVSPAPADRALETGRPGQAAGAVRLKQPIGAPAQKAPLAKPRRTLGQIARMVAGEVDLERLRRKVFTPVRIVLSGIVLVIGLTAWWMMHLKALERAERTIVSAARLGDEALASGDLPEAARQFGMVRASLDLLGRNDPPSRRMRQTAAEVTAAAGLAQASLFELLHDAGDAASGRASLTWAETFRLNYRHSWVVLDASVSRAAEPASDRRFDIDFPLIAGSDKAVIVGDLDIFDKAVGAGESSRRLIFAAQLDDCRRENERERTWTISLRPSTGFLWSSAERLERLGVEVDDGTQRVLDEQTEHLGIDR